MRALYGPGLEEAPVPSSHVPWATARSRRLPAAGRTGRWVLTVHEGEEELQSSPQPAALRFPFRGSLRELFCNED